MRKRLRTPYFGSILSILVVLLCFCGVALVDAQTPTLRSTFNSPSCQRACWLGIEPGVTTDSQVQSILNTNGISYQISADGRGWKQYYWIPTNLGPFITNRNGGSNAGVDVVGDTVYELSFPVDISLESIINAYGAPTWVLEDTLSDRGIIEIVYSNYGMVFFTGTFGNPNQISRLTLTTDAGMQVRYIPLPPQIPYLQDCTIFGPPPCIVATATVTPTPTPTPTPAASQAVTSFTLINADTDQPVPGFDPLPNGATINIATIGTANLSIRANTSPSTVGSVRFGLNGVSNFRVESGTTCVNSSQFP